MFVNIINPEYTHFSEQISTIVNNTEWPSFEEVLTARYGTTDDFAISRAIEKEILEGYYSVQLPKGIIAIDYIELHEVHYNSHGCPSQRLTIAPEGGIPFTAFLYCAYPSALVKPEFGIYVPIQHNTIYNPTHQILNTKLPFPVRINFESADKAVKRNIEFYSLDEIRYFWDYDFIEPNLEMFKEEINQVFIPIEELEE